jgi:hypothetical protein
MGAADGTILILEADQWDPSVGAIEFEGHRYKLFDTPLRWHDADRACGELGGHLVTITSAAENEFVRGLAREGNHCVWLGVTDRKVEGVWEWVTGEPFDFSAWARGEPNNHMGGEHYGVMWRTRTGSTWNDTEATNRNAYVCEWGTPAAPNDEKEPAKEVF